MEGPPLGPGGEDITWPDQVAPRGRKASSTRKIKPQTSNLLQQLQKLCIILSVTMYISTRSCWTATELRMVAIRDASRYTEVTMLAFYILIHMVQFRSVSTDFACDTVCS